MGAIRVMITDDNGEIRRLMREAIEQQEDMTVAGECANGLEALEMLGRVQADVMVLDLIMPQMDGYALLAEMAAQQPEHMPQVIILSALGRDDFVMRAMALGARYYMVKPFEAATLCDRIRDACGRGESEEALRVVSRSRVPTLDERLAGLFLNLGIPAHIKGYQYLRDAVKIVMDNPDVINRITKELYPGIGRHFGTTASKVERAIRHAIEVAWSRGRVETLNKAFGCRIATPEDKPTNGEFIAMIADMLSLERESA